MIYQPLSPKQKIAMLWWLQEEYRHRDGIICDGAVRSGKTMSLAVGFLLWSMTQFSGQVFAFCGKTIESLRRNLVNLIPEWLGGIFTFEFRRQENLVLVRKGETVNYYYLFGGRDQSSAGLIQGITLAGVLLDEVVLMPRSFVEQAVARCSVPNSKVFFSCNPESPGHWFYGEWVEKAAEKRLLRLQFTMEDNPALTPEVRERYARMYAGQFYRRFVLGQWCAAQGLVYPFQPEEVTADSLSGPLRYYISVDYGTRNPCSMGLWAVDLGGRALRLREYYHDSRKAGEQRTDGEYYEALCALAADNPISAVVVDPSALSFLTLIRRAGRFSLRKADNRVLDGIRTVGEYLKNGRLKVHPRCTSLLEELSRYRWDQEAAEDRPVKENDHAMDEMRYFVMTILRKL